jgi:hypothetical protein
MEGEMLKGHLDMIVDTLVAAGQTMIGRDAGTITAFLGSAGLPKEKVAGRP